MRRAVPAALAGAIALFAIALGLVLSSSAEVVAGSNSVPIQGSLGAARGNASGCELGGTIPTATNAVRIALGANVGPNVAVRLESNQLVVSSGDKAAGWGIAESVTIPVDRVARPVTNGRVCFHLGPTLEAIEGQGGAVEGVNSKGQKVKVESLRVEYLRPGRSWWSQLSAVTERMGFGHAPAGAAGVAIELLLMAAVLALAVGLVARSALDGDATPGPGQGPIGSLLGRLAGSLSSAPARRLPRRASGGATDPADAAQADGPLRAQGGLARAGRHLVAAFRRIPPAARVCACVAILNAACWSLLTPPFQVPDEPSHFAYVQLLAENGSLANSGPEGEDTNWSEQEKVALVALHHQQVRFHPEVKPIETAAEQNTLEAELARPTSRYGEGGTGVAHTEPPLYYALQTIPYYLGKWFGGSLLDSLELMRLLSSLMAGLTALFAFLFVREALPRVRWAWTAAGLTVAMAPLLGMMSGAVNPDALSVAVSACGLFLVARGFRRGLTRRLAAGIGLAIAVGTITKLNYLGLVPGMLLALLVLAFRSARPLIGPALRGLFGSRSAPAPRRTKGRGGAPTKGARARGTAAASRAQQQPAASGLVALRPLVPSLLTLTTGVAVALAPAILYLAYNLARGRELLGSGVPLLHPTGGHGTLWDEASYIWQFYLPKFPGMTTDFPGLAPWHGIWFNRWVGLYGWLDTTFPQWLYRDAFVVVVGLAALVLSAVVMARRSLRFRVGEFAVYLVLLIGVLVLTGSASYLQFPAQAGRYGEPRYMLPLIPMLGALAALAVRGAGRRWGPVAMVLLVMLVFSWDVFSQLQVIARFYG